MLLKITEVNEIKKFNIAKKINGNAFNASVICSRLNSLHLHSSVKIKKSRIGEGGENEHFLPIPCNVKAYIIDFEEIQVFGIMFRNQCFQYYCLDLENREVFYRWIEAIFEILKVFNDNGLIAFAFHENERLLLQKFYNILEIKGGDLSNYSFIPNLLVVNLQESKYESLTEVLYSLGYLNSGDSLFRNNKLIPELAGRLAEFPDLINLILSHNRNCLCNENIILLERFLPKYCLTVRD